MVRAVWTDPLPQGVVERVAPNQDIAGVVWEMERLAEAGRAGGAALRQVVEMLPRSYADWIRIQADGIKDIGGVRRQETATRLIEAMQRARERIEAGIDLIVSNDAARLAFIAMNDSVQRAARQRNAQGNGKRPEDQTPPAWRPFQLAFILLNLLVWPTRNTPTARSWICFSSQLAAAKTEAYLGLAAWTIAYRRLGASGKLGAGVTVLMRYTLRLLTLDQLSRAAGVVCALELMRGEPEWTENGQSKLGSWPIEIGLYVGSAASPNALGGKGNNGPETAVTRIKRYQTQPRRIPAPAPLQACPWCGTAFGPSSFSLAPNAHAPQTMEIRCVEPTCAFTGDRPLPIVTVDEAIYRRLPAFLIATVDNSLVFPGLNGPASSSAT